MRRIKLLLAAATAMTMLLAVSAAPAVAWHQWVDIDEVTDLDWDDGVLEIEAVGEFLGKAAEFELVCWDWWSCELTDMDLL